MTTTTSNLGLVLYNGTTDQTATFSAFRLALAGDGAGSNMDLIDDWSIIVDGDIADLQAYRGAIPVNANYVAPNEYAVGSITAITAYTTGLMIALTVDTTSSGTATLDINTLGAKSLMKVNAAGSYVNLTGSDLRLEKVYLFIYDGTRWLWVGATSGDQISVEGTSGNVATLNSDKNLIGTVTPAVLVGSAISASPNKAVLVDGDKLAIVNFTGDVIGHIVFSDFKNNLPASNRSWFGV